MPGTMPPLSSIEQKVSVREQHPLIKAIGDSRRRHAQRSFALVCILVFAALVLAAHAYNGLF